MQKTSETKVLRDPVHGYIHVDLQVVWDCINAVSYTHLDVYQRQILAL